MGVLCGNLGRDRVTYLDRPYRPVLSMMPTKYEDIWTAAKGFYKLEPIVADGGELIIYAPHITQVSVMHPIITKIGYHNRDYFLGRGTSSVTGLGATPLTQHIGAARVGGIPSMASKTESPSPLRRAYFVHGEIYAESASPFPFTPTPPPMSPNTDVLEHLGPTLREWISTWQSTDRGGCIVVMARSSRSQPDLTALSQGPGHHMRTIRHPIHRVIAEVPHDAQGVRDALTERLNPEQNPSARLDRPSTRAPRVSDV